MADGDGRTGGEVLAAIFAVLLGSMMFGQTAPGVAAFSVARGAAVEVLEDFGGVCTFVSGPVQTGNKMFSRCVVLLL